VGAVSFGKAGGKEAGFCGKIGGSFTAVGGYGFGSVLARSVDPLGGNNAAGVGANIVGGPFIVELAAGRP